MGILYYFFLIERTEDGQRQPKRGLVLLDGDRTVRYRWEAENNWDEWEMTPLSEVHDLNTIVDGET